MEGLPGICLEKEEEKRKKSIFSISDIRQKEWGRKERKRKWGERKEREKEEVARAAFFLVY